MAIEPNRLRAMVAEGKSNLSIALTLNTNIRDVILAVRGLELEDDRDGLKTDIDYTPTGLPERKYQSWTTGECAAVLAGQGTADRMAKKLGRTAGAVKTRRSTMKRERKMEAIRGG